MIELVVARYKERVEWTRNVPPSVRVTIYDKGGDLDPAVVPRAAIARLPNVGREAHTYLHHLTTRLERGDLAPTTVFCQGHPFDHASDLHAILRDLAAGRAATPDFRWLGFIVDTDDARGRRLFQRWSKNEDGRELALDELHAALFDAPCPPMVPFYCGGQFVVSAARVRTRPLAFYTRALALAESFPDAAHGFERLWDRVFDVVGVPPELLGGELCRYLKPIRRLASSTDASGAASGPQASETPRD